MKKKVIVSIVCVLVLISLFGCAQAPQTPAETEQPPASEVPKTPGPQKIKLVYAVHWMDTLQINGVYEGDQLKSKGLTQYLDDYEALRPDIEFEVKQIQYGDYESQLKVLHEADAVPDIYQIYSGWGVTYENLDMLDSPPQDIIDDVNKNFMTTSGVTINGQVWGIPTEINDYSLLYNKELLKEAGVVDENGEAKPPKTWKEFVQVAKKTTKKDEKGNIVQYGFATLKGNDWQIVDPFLSLLFTNGGKYLSDDHSQCLVNSKEGIETLNSMMDLFQQKSTDINSNFFDFGKGTVAMVISPPWVEGMFKDALGDKYESVLGVAPVPPMDKAASLQYSWFMGVMAKSKHKKEAWDFLRWFATEVQPGTGTTRYGDLLAQTIGAIPSRTIDIEGNQESLNSIFKKGYVEELSNSVPEPNIMEGAEVKKILMAELEAAYAGEKTPKQALDSACEQIDPILAQYYPVE